MICTIKEKNVSVRKCLNGWKESHVEEQVERLWESGEQGVHCEILSSSNSRSYSHKFSQTWLSEYELNNTNANRHTKVGKGMGAGVLIDGSLLGLKPIQTRGN